MTIQDEDGNTINIYTVKDYDGTMYGDISEENKPQVGDYVTIQGSIGMYRDVAEINIGYLAPNPFPTMMATGVARPRAQGQEMTSTQMPLARPTDRG